MDTIWYTGDLTSESAYTSENMPDEYKEIGLSKPCNIGPKYVIDLDNVLDQQMYGDGALLAYLRDEKDPSRKLYKDRFYICRIF